MKTCSHVQVFTISVEIVNNSKLKFKNVTIFICGIGPLKS